MSALCDRHFLDEIRRQTNLEDASAVLAECAQALGWNLAAFHADTDAVDLPRTKKGEFIAAMMGWPSECLLAWRTAGLGLHCPIAQRCGRVVDPFCFSCDARDSGWFDGELSIEQRKVLDHYGRYVTSGTAVPVRLAAGNTGYVSWCSRDREVAVRTHAGLGSMFFISHVFIRHAEWLLSTEAGGMTGQLTARERQCLTWAARGKSEEEIALILGRSRDTVHFHLRNAAMKLDAGNRTHAVAIACTRGLISLR